MTRTTYLYILTNRVLSIVSYHKICHLTLFSKKRLNQSGYLASRTHSNKDSGLPLKRVSCLSDRCIFKGETLQKRKMAWKRRKIYFSIAELIFFNEYSLKRTMYEGVPLVEFMYLVFTRMQVTITEWDSGLCCCAYVTSFERWLTPLCADSLKRSICSCVFFVFLCGYFVVVVDAWSWTRYKGFSLYQRRAEKAWLVTYYFDTFATYSGLVYDVTDTDCWA